MKSKVINFTYSLVSKAGAPYVKDEVVQFTFSGSGLLFIKKATGADKNIGNLTKVGNEYVWQDTTLNLTYMLSLTTDGSINEINVFTTPYPI